jgi:hypothetical protein
MALTAKEFEVKQGGGGSSQQFGKGIFVNECTIASAQLQYNVAARPGWNPSDVVLELELSISGLKFDKKFTLNGDFQRDDAGVIIGIGSAFLIWQPVADLLDGTMDIELEKGKAKAKPEAISKALIGRKVWVLDYIADTKEVDGKVRGKYYTFRYLVTLREGETGQDASERLAAYFMAQVEKGREKAYNPRLVDELAGGTAHAAPKATAAAYVTEKEDLPF